MSPSWEKSTNRSGLLWLNAGLFLAVVMVTLLSTALSNDRVNTGSEVNDLLQKQSELTERVSQLKWHISQYKSLHYIESYADSELKMQPVDKNILYLPTPTSSHD